MSKIANLANIASSYVFNEERALAAFKRDPINPPVQTLKEALEARRLGITQTPAVVHAAPIRSGGAIYADLTRHRDQVVIAFTSEEEAAEVFALVEDLLRKRASE